jgi:hypothetical protein
MAGHDVMLRLVMMQYFLVLQVFLATFLSHFNLHMAPRMGSPEEALASIRYHITLCMPQGLWMKAVPR